MKSPAIVNLSLRECVQNAWYLGPDQAHIWHIPFNKCLIDARILSSDEILRANEYKFEIHKNRFMVRRCVLRQILSFYFNKSPQDLTFSYSEYGKPYISVDSLPLQFSLSHSDEMTVLGLTKFSPIGLDVEYIKPLKEMQLLAEQFFSKAEFCKFISLPEKDKLGAFYNIWTRKEAFVKAVGKGLSYPLHKFSVSFCENETPIVIDIDNTEIEAIEWIIRSFDLEANGKSYKIACLVKNKTCELRRYMLST